MEKKTVFVLTSSREEFNEFLQQVSPLSHRFSDFCYIATNATIQGTNNFIYTLYGNYRDHPCFDQIMEAIKSRKAVTFVTAPTFLMEEDENAQDSDD